MECVQLAAAFLPASLLAGVSPPRIMPRLNLGMAQARRIASKLVWQQTIFQTSQQAGWGKKRQQAARTPKLRSVHQRWEIYTNIGETGEGFG